MQTITGEFRNKFNIRKIASNEQNAMKRRLWSASSKAQILNWPTNHNGTRRCRQDSRTDGHISAAVQYTFRRRIWTHRQYTLSTALLLDPLHDTHTNVEIIHDHYLYLYTGSLVYLCRKHAFSEQRSSSTILLTYLLTYLSSLWRFYDSVPGVTLWVFMLFLS